MAVPAMKAGLLALCLGLVIIYLCHRISLWAKDFDRDWDGWQTDEYLWERDRLAKLRALAEQEGREAVVRGEAGLPK